MKKTRVTIAGCRDGEYEWQEIPAYESGVPGLVIHKHVDRNWQLVSGHWNVTHAASGKTISPLGRPIVTCKEAVGFAQELAGLVDWTRCEEYLQAGLSPELKRVIGDKIRAACQKYAAV